MDFTRIIITTFFFLCLFQANSQISGTVTDKDRRSLDAMIFIDGGNKSVNTNKKGQYSLKITAGDYKIVAFASGYRSQIAEISFDGTSLDLDFEMEELLTELDAVTVQGSRSEDLGMIWLQSVEGVAIYEAKKTELIQLEGVSGNLDLNTNRQTYSRVPGLNIFENDGVGVQLAIGARGLNPNRTSNFNVRQNGYDIAADALGYPESYYTPPVVALERIEIIRGAAGLQYGPQFGGLLNFKFREGSKEKKAAFRTVNTAGSYGLLSSFNSVGGTIGKMNYYGFYQYRKSEGWRPNSEINQSTAYGSFKYNINPFVNVKAEFTHMTYLAEQAGGLSDVQFESDPTQSFRPRNWFGVGWNTGAVTLNYRINSKIKINNRTFFLKAHRYSLGDLGRVVDLDTTRSLIKDDFLNWGNETRATWHYTLGQNKSIFLLGARYYQGFTDSSQGEGSSGFDANFSYKHGTPSGSSFDFPSKNISVFAENIFNISDKLSLTPGIRYEHILTKADGVYTNVISDFAGNPLVVESITESRSNPRDFLLYGLGVSFKHSDKTEFYANFSRNYRGINFTDIRVDIPGLIVDPNISDENGFNLDLGIRGGSIEKLQYDASVFLLSYNDRIGNTRLINDSTSAISTFRTNIGDAIIFGFESYAEKTLFNSPFLAFMNFAWIYSEYTKINVQGTLTGELVPGNRVELVPSLNIKTGLKYQTDKLKGSLLFSFVSDQFSEASNSPSSFNGGSQGPIPAYKILDISMSYPWKSFIFGAGINNALDEKYFARRAVGYPGPGIIPSQPRSYYLTLEIKI